MGKDMKGSFQRGRVFLGLRKYCVQCLKSWVLHKKFANNKSNKSSLHHQGRWSNRNKNLFSIFEEKNIVQ